MPTSLCSGQIARLIADRLDVKLGGPNSVLSRIVALPHTEGCGVSSGISEAMYARTMLGYLTHPLVKFGLLLEHGCEKTHNDYMANQLERMGCDPQSFGWASVQLDGGIDAVTAKADAWFANALADTAAPVYEPCGLHALRLGLLTTGPVSPDIAETFAHLTHAIAGSGGTIVLPETSALLSSPDFRDQVLTTPSVTPSLAYGQVADTPGLHVMETPTEHWVGLTGIGATGVELMLAHVTGHPRQAHPLVPLLQVTSDSADVLTVDVDLALTAPSASWTDELLRLLLDTASRTYAPKLYAQGNTDFQVSRGLLGISL